jgi:hypothetical protein
MNWTAGSAVRPQGLAKRRILAQTIWTAPGLSPTAALSPTCFFHKQINTPISIQSNIGIPSTWLVWTAVVIDLPHRAG